MKAAEERLKSRQAASQKEPDRSAAADEPPAPTEAKREGSAQSQRVLQPCHHPSCSAAVASVPLVALLCLNCRTQRAHMYHCLVCHDVKAVFKSLQCCDAPADSCALIVSG